MMVLSLTHHKINHKTIWLLLLTLIVVTWVYRRNLSSYSFSVNYSADYMMPGVTVLDFRGMDIIEYYLFYFKDRFYDYPWVIRTAFTVILASVLVGVCILLFLFRFVFREIMSKHRHRVLLHKFHDGICKVLSDSSELSELEIDNILGLHGVQLKKCMLRDLVDVLIGIHFELGDNINTHNRDIVFNLLGVDQHISRTLLLGSYKDCMRLLQSMRLLEVNVQPGLMIRLVNSRFHPLRSLARICYFMSNRSNPYELLDKDYLNRSFTPWDALNLHECMRVCKKQGRLMPSYMALLNELKDPLVKPYLIYGAGFWGTDDEVRHMSDFFSKEDTRCRNAAYSIMGWRKCLSEESAIMKRYWVENENSRSLIVRDVFEMRSGRAVDFYKEAYNKTASYDTKLQILYALRYYNEESVKVFQELKRKALPEQSILFEHVQNPLIINQLKEISNERVFV